MVRAPCCDKSGLKKGPWSADEDQMLVAYISSYGHANWRALPKQAGLLRCGKSCRLRWTNYLRPDIKRGNFSKEEEEMIASLHEKLGNRWSAIAARLPGRTDNEIKNVWHTHIKKRLLIQQNHESKPNINVSSKGGDKLANSTQMEVEPKPILAHPMSPEWSCISNSSGTDFSSMSNNNASIKKLDLDQYCMASSSQQDMFDIDESFWSEALSTENSNASIDVPISATTMINEPLRLPKDDGDDSMNFWLSILMEAGDF